MLVASRTRMGTSIPVEDARSVTPRASTYARTLLWFLAGNLVLLAADAYGYILAAGGVPWSTAWLFAHLALLSQIGVATLAAGLVLLLVGGIGGWRWLAVLAPAVATLLNLYVYVDRSVFAFYRFHLGWLELQALATPGGLAALRVEPSTSLLFAVVLLLDPSDSAMSAARQHLTDHNSNRRRLPMSARLRCIPD